VSYLTVFYLDFLLWKPDWNTVQCLGHRVCFLLHILHSIDSVPDFIWRDDSEHAGTLIPHNFRILLRLLNNVSTFTISRFNKRRVFWKLDDVEDIRPIPPDYQTIDNLCFQWQLYFLQALTANGLYVLLLGILTVFNNSYNAYGDIYSLPIIIICITLFIHI
jgi:hypothetical protein